MRIGDGSKPWIAVALGGIVCLQGIAGAAPVGSLDQSMTNLTNTLYVDGDGGGRPRAGQSVTPTMAFLTDVELNVASKGGSVEPVTEFRLSVFAADGVPDADGAGAQQGDGPTGAALGSKTLLASEITFDGNLNDLFTFDAPIAVVPGSKYFLEFQVIQDGGAIDSVNLGFNNNTDIYEQGRMVVQEGGVYQYHDGVASRDLQFRTFGVVPEPASLGLLGLIGLGALRRSRH